jgi:hypothetical protein
MARGEAPKDGAPPVHKAPNPNVLPSSLDELPEYKEQMAKKNNPTPGSS